MKLLVVAVFILSAFVPPAAHSQDREIVGSAHLGLATRGGLIVEIHIDLISHKLLPRWRHHRLSAFEYDDWGSPSDSYWGDGEPPRRITSIGCGRGARVSKRWYFASITVGPSIIVTPISLGAHAHTTLLFMPMEFFGFGFSGTVHPGLRDTSWAGWTCVVAARF